MLDQPPPSEAMWRIESQAAVSALGIVLAYQWLFLVR